MKKLLFVATITLLSCSGTKQPPKSESYFWYKEQISNQLITIEFNKKDSIKLITKN